MPTWQWWTKTGLQKAYREIASLLYHRTYHIRWWFGYVLEKNFSRRQNWVFIVGANIRLQEHVVQFSSFVGENFLLVHDNAKPHTAVVVRQYLQEVSICVMEWPARSRDLNPIEYCRDGLKRKIKCRNIAPANLQELQTALKEEWDGIPQDCIKHLIEYECISGGRTKTIKCSGLLIRTSWGSFTLEYDWYDLPSKCLRGL